MAFNPQDYQTQYAAINFVWNKWRSGKLDEMDILEYYGAKSEMFKSKFNSAKEEYNKGKKYLKKHLVAEAEAEKIARRINSVERDSKLVNYCEGIIRTMGPANTARFWGI